MIASASWLVESCWRINHYQLWMGTHPSSPSRLLTAETPSLASHLAGHPELLGSSILSRFASEGSNEGNLPFLFKVLSIQKALSIQTHPDKATAEKLHEEKPNVYKGTSVRGVPQLGDN